MTNFLAGLPCYFEGTDDSTPPDCTLFVTKVFDLPTTYILRGAEIIGRVEMGTEAGSPHNGYVGSSLKGGTFVGSGRFVALAEKIADHAKGE